MYRLVTTGRRQVGTHAVPVGWSDPPRDHRLSFYKTKKKSTIPQFMRLYITALQHVSALPPSSGSLHQNFFTAYVYHNKQLYNIYIHQQGYRALTGMSNGETG
jgi:hypothetical protein